MTPQEALTGLRTMIESQGPDTANRHYGRNQYNWLIECCDTIGAALGNDAAGETPSGLSEGLRTAAEQPIEDFVDPDELAQAWLTADDIAGRLRDRLRELRYWWEP